MNAFEGVMARPCPVQAGRCAAIGCVRPGPIAIAALLISLGCIAGAQTTAAWRYDLRLGDRLIYRYTFQRRTQSKEDESQVEARFNTHVLVVAQNPQHISLGFQRNRETAELTESRSKGKDRLALDRVDFQKRMKRRPFRFSEAMEISPAGEPLYTWEFARETYSHLIETFHEVMTLPPTPPTRGAPSKGAEGLDFQWVDDESIHGKLCHHVEGTRTNGSLKLSYWWSPESGILEQVAFEGRYTDYGGTVYETARMELQSRSRGEPLEDWLGSAESRLGALQGMLLTPVLPISAAQLAPLLTSDDTPTQTLALAVAHRHKVVVPSDLLAKLRQSSSAAAHTLLAPNSPDPPSFQDGCLRARSAESPPAKFGTLLQVAPAPRNNEPDNNGSPIPYLLRIPLTYREDRSSPLLVYLSGGAGLAIDGVNTAEDVVSQTDYFVLYPQAPAYWWTPQAARSFDSVFNDVVQRYNIDRDRIYLTGFSNGGTGALYFAELWPQRFAAVVSLMGAGQCNDQVKAGLPNLKNLPLFFIHGENDPLITPACSSTTHAAFTDLHPAVEAQLKILPNHGHDITLQSDEGLTLPFFKDKVRNPFPHTVDLREFDVLAARAYWVEILDGKPGRSDLDARVKPDNTIEIHSHEVKSIRLHLRAELLPKPSDFRIVWNGQRIANGPLRDYCALPGSPRVTPASIEDPKLDLTDRRDLTLP